MTSLERRTAPVTIKMKSSTSPDVTWKVRRPSKLLIIWEAEVTKEMITTAVQPLTNGSFDLQYYSCQHCSFCSYDSGKFQEHVLSRRPGAIFRCHLCVFKSCTSFGMSIHTQEMHSSLPINFEIVPKIESVRTVAGPKAHEAESSSLPTENLVDLQVSKLLTPKEKSRYQCDYCPKQFGEKSVFELHIKAHTGEREFKCNRCRYSTKWQTALVRHMRTRNVIALQCPHCDLKFCFQVSLSSHLKASHADVYKVEPITPVLFKYGEDDDPVVDEPMEDVQAKLPVIKCLQCDATFLNELLFLQHYNDWHGVTSGSSSNTWMRPTPVEETTQREEKQKTIRFAKEVLLFRLETETEETPSPDEKFICHVCNKQFKIRLHLEHHYATHGDEDIFKCHVCSFATKYCNQLQVHQESSKRRDGHVFFCTECDFKSCTSSYFQIHLNEIHLNDVASTCEQPQLTWPQSLPRPLQETTDDSSNPEMDEPHGVQHICSFCNKLFKSKGHLDEHVRTHNDDSEKRFKCDRCSYASNNEVSIERHKHSRGRMEGLLHSCNKCTFKSCTSNSLQRHSKIHWGEDIPSERLEKLEVDDAPLLTTIKDTSTDRSKQEVHHQWPEIKKTLAICQFCKKVFTGSRKQWRLQNHIRIHTGEKPFKCNHCSYSSAHRSALNAHKRRHYPVSSSTIRTKRSELISKRCNYCNFTACSSTVLQKHVEDSHSAETVNEENSPSVGNWEDNNVKWEQLKLHKCTYCDYRSRNRYNVRSHERIHTGEKSFVCKICGKAFSQRTGLYNHKFTHLRNKSVEMIGNDLQITNLSLKPGIIRNPENPKSNETLRQGERINIVVKDKVCTMKAKLKTFKQLFHCEFCPYKTKNQSHIVDHTRTHTGEKPFNCTYCPHRTIRSYDLKLHELRHVARGDKKVFRQFSPQPQLPQLGSPLLPKLGDQQEIKDEMELKKPFKCKFCNHRADRRTIIETHERTHKPGQKQFDCRDCGSRFARLTSLLKHRQTHLT